MILSEMADAAHLSHLGVAKLGDDGVISEIVEKPADPPSRFAVTGRLLLRVLGLRRRSRRSSPRAAASSRSPTSTTSTPATGACATTSSRASGATRASRSTATTSSTTTCASTARTARRRPPTLRGTSKSTAPGGGGGVARPPCLAAVVRRSARLCWPESPCWDTDSYGLRRRKVCPSRAVVPVAVVDRARLRVRARVSIRFALVELARSLGVRRRNVSPTDSYVTTPSRPLAGGVIGVRQNALSVSVARTCRCPGAASQRGRRTRRGARESDPEGAPLPLPHPAQFTFVLLTAAAGRPGTTCAAGRS